MLLQMLKDMANMQPNKLAGLQCYAARMIAEHLAVPDAFARAPLSDGMWKGYAAGIPSITVFSVWGMLHIYLLTTG